MHKEMRSTLKIMSIVVGAVLLVTSWIFLYLETDRQYTRGYEMGSYQSLYYYQYRNEFPCISWRKLAMWDDHNEYESMADWITSVEVKMGCGCYGHPVGEVRPKTSGVSISNTADDEKGGGP